MSALESLPFLKALTRHLLLSAHVGSGDAADGISFKRMPDDDVTLLTNALNRTADISHSVGDYDEALSCRVRTVFVARAQQFITDPALPPSIHPSIHEWRRLGFAAASRVRLPPPPPPPVTCAVPRDPAPGPAGTAAQHAEGAELPGRRYGRNASWHGEPSGARLGGLRPSAQ